LDAIKLESPLERARPDQEQTELNPDFAPPGWRHWSGQRCQPLASPD
jgi:hypothetical protein